MAPTEAARPDTLAALCEAAHTLLQDGSIAAWPDPADEPPDVWRGAARAALEELVAAGRLAAPDAHGQPLAAHVAALVSGPLAPSLAETPGRALLAGELLRNLARPGRINQGLKFTCAATCVEIELAERDPGEYARLVAGLVAPEGSVALRSGAPLVRDEDRLAWDAAEARRSPVSRLLQAAFMELAFPDLDYRNAADRHFDGAAGSEQGYGVDLDAFDRLLEAVTGERWDTLSERESRMARLFASMGLPTDGLPDLARDALTLVERTTAAGETLFATLHLARVGDPFGGGGGGEGGGGGAPAHSGALSHKVRLLAIDRSAPDGPRVVYDDPVDPAHPWYLGLNSRVEDAYGRCSLPLAELRAALVELSYRPRFWEELKQPVPAPGVEP